MAPKAAVTMETMIPPPEAITIILYNKPPATPPIIPINMSPRRPMLQSFMDAPVSQPTAPPVTTRIIKAMIFRASP